MVIQRPPSLRVFALIALLLCHRLVISDDVSSYEDKEPPESFSAEDESGAVVVAAAPPSWFMEDADLDEDDDRTLLDVFGQVAKDYLTNKVVSSSAKTTQQIIRHSSIVQIPGTDAMCRWDWRSTRCEPHCECEIQPRWGDYHLGRFCRRRLVEQSTCLAVPPNERWQRQPAARRLVSLIRQTMDLIRERLERVTLGLTQKFTRRIHAWQERTCGELWQLQREQQQSMLACLAPHQVPEIRWQQQVACGPTVEWRICEGFKKGESMNN